MKLPVIPGMERVRGQGVPHRALGLRVHRRRRRTTRTSPSWPTRSSASSAWARAGSRRVPPLAESAKHVYVFQRTPSAIGVRGNRPTDERLRRAAPARLAAGADGELQRGHDRASGRRAISSTTAGRATPRGSTTRVVEPGMTPEDIAAQVEEFDYEVMEEHRHAHRRDRRRSRRRRRCSSRTTATGASGPASTTSTSPAFNNPNVTLVDCPGGVDADHRARCDRQRHRVRARLHRLRHRVRGRAHAVPAARRSHDHRARRRHDGGEVEGRRHQPARHDDARLPEHVHHAGARAAGRHHRTTSRT